MPDSMQLSQEPPTENPATAADVDGLLRDSRRTVEERVAEVVASMTLSEKLVQMHGRAEAVQRLGLPAYVAGIEVLHGVRWKPKSTAFPQAIGLGASWNVDLLTRIGSAIGDEVRALHREDPEASLNCWGPVVNLLRDPRWGRNEEGYSECPTLTSALAVAMCTGLTGRDRSDAGAVLKTAPTLKAFVGYNFETRGTASADIRPRVLREYELRPFEAAINAGVASSVMLAYTRVNERPNCVSPYINKIVRQWYPDIVVLSDAWAPTYLAMELEGYFADRLHAYAAAVKAGLDIFIDQDEDNSIIVWTLERALEAGLLEESHIDAAVRRILRMRYTLGEFDPEDENPYREAEKTEVDGPSHRAIAAEAARQGIVLLKNDGGMLPFGPDRIHKVAVIGQLADVLYRDWYSGPHRYGATPLSAMRAEWGEERVVYTPALDHIILRHSGGGLVGVGPEEEGSPLGIQPNEPGPAQTFEVHDWGAGIVTLRSMANGRFVSAHLDGVLHNDQVNARDWVVPERLALIPHEGEWVVYSPAAECYVMFIESSGQLAAITPELENAARFTVETVLRGADEAAKAAAEADAAFVFVGNHPLINGRETEDRPDMLLAASQEKVAEAVIAASPRATVVLVSSYPMTITGLAERAPALLWTSHAGPELGGAIADTVVGRNSPAGRLTQTWPRAEEDLGDLHDFDIISTGKTYLYSDKPPLFPFGHGLTYPEFWYRLRLHRPVLCQEDSIGLRATVTNMGTADSDEVVQLYWRALDSRHERPLRQLGGFQRIHIPAGQTRTPEFDIPMRDLAMWDPASDDFVVEPGRYEFLLGRSSADIVDRALLTVRGEPQPLRDLLSRPARAIDFDACNAVDLTDADLVEGEAIAARGPGSWLCFRNVDLADVASLTAEVCRPEPGWSALEVRVGDPVKGPLLGVLPIIGGGGRHDWKTVTCDVKSSSGQADLYFTATGQLRFHTFRFDRTQGDPEPDHPVPLAVSPPLP